MAAPGALDRMMASRAWDGQMTDEPATARPDNLFAPVPGDRGAAGRFTSAARARAMSAPAAGLRAALAAARFALAAGVVAWALAPHRRGGRIGTGVSRRGQA
jgi:hypothetical protein